MSRRTTATALGAGLLALCLIGCGGAQAEPAGSAPATSPGRTEGSDGATAIAGDDGEASDAGATGAGAAGAGATTPVSADPTDPVSLEVGDGPTWELTALGVDAEGFINPPAGVVQWYDASPRPGEPGIAVVAGHVSYGGAPDAFADLDRTEVGDQVVVVDDDGVERRFEVTEVRAADKDDVMTDPDVWGPSAEPRLAIVTCDDASGVEGGGHYAGNLVVEAVAVDG